MNGFGEQNIFARIPSYKGSKNEEEEWMDGDMERNPFDEVVCEERRETVYLIERVI